MQGAGGPGDEASCNVNSDKIIAFRARIVDGVPGAFERVGRISPCVNAPVTDPEHPAHPNPPASFGPGQVFRDRGRYHLLADASDTITFNDVWRAESPDGINWTWTISDAINNQQFSGRRETLRDPIEHTIDIVVRHDSFIHSDTVAVLNPILTASGNGSWWGFLNFYDDGFAIGRMTVDWTGNVPTVKVVDQSFRYRTANRLDFVPWAFRRHANAKTLLYDHGYQLWASSDALGQYGANVDCDTTRIVRCDRAEGCPTGDGSGCAFGESCNAFLRNTGDPGDVMRGSGGGFVWYAVTPTSLGPPHVVGSRTRDLPSGYAESRLFPFRWNSPTGRRYLFSATNDANICTELLFSAFFKMYVVRTEVEK